MNEFLQYLETRLHERFPLPAGWQYKTSVIFSGPVADTTKTVFHAEAIGEKGRSFSVATAAWLGSNPADAYKAIDAAVNNLWSAAIYNNIYALAAPEQFENVQTNLQGSVTPEQITEVISNASPEDELPDNGSPIFVADDEDKFPFGETIQPISVDVEEESSTSADATDSRLTKPSKPVTGTEITVGKYYLTFPIPNATQRAASVIAFNLVKGREVPLPGFGKKVKIVDGEYRGEVAKFEVEVLENPIPIAVLVYGIGILVGLAFVTLSLVKIEQIVEASPEIVSQIGGTIGNFAVVLLILVIAWLAHKFSG